MNDLDNDEDGQLIRIDLELSDEDIECLEMLASHLGTTMQIAARRIVSQHG